MSMINRLFKTIDDRFRRKVLLKQMDGSSRSFGVNAENAAEEWFKDAVKETKLLSYRRSNGFPDFYVWYACYKNSPEMYEIKARKGDEAHINFNSTLPFGTKKEQNVFYVFINYTHADLAITSIAITHGSYWTRSIENAEELVKSFKSNTNPIKNTRLTVRNRYFFEGNSPKGDCPKLDGKCSLVLPADWKAPVDVPRRTTINNFDVYYE